MKNHPLRQFIEKNMCRYHSIYPTVGSVLHHLLYVNGNGYDIDPVNGLPYTQSYRGTKKNYLHETAGFKTKAARQKFADAVHKEDQESNDTRTKSMLERMKAFSESTGNSDLYNRYLAREAEAIAVPPIVSIPDEAFDVDHLLADLYVKGQARGFRGGDIYPRPYPLCQYATTYHINDQSPLWFVDLALNHSMAWEIILITELETKHFDDNEYGASETATLESLGLVQAEIKRLYALLIKIMPENGTPVV